MEPDTLPKAPPKAAAWATIFGYEDVAVKFLDGQSQLVRVRQVRARQAFFVLGIIELEYELIEFVCVGSDNSPLPDGWADLLTHESFVAVLEKARSLNFPIVLGAVKRSLEMAGALGDVTPMVQKVEALTNSSTTAPSR